MLRTLYRFLSPRFQSLFLEYKVDLRPRYGHGRPPHPELYELIASGRERYTGLLAGVLDLREELWAIRRAGEETDPDAPVWNNGFLPGLDIALLYFFLHRHRPKTYLEVGSGNSTKVARRCIDAHGLETRIVSIDPHPRVEIGRLIDEEVRQGLETADLAIFDRLEAGDILFIDNSHRVLPNSDATVFFLEVLPRLRPGVIVHVHDVYLPYDYPPFMCDRFYSEQYLLAAFLLANPGRYPVLMPNYFVSEDDALRAAIAPLWEHPNLGGVERHGGSFWFTLD